MTKPDKIRIFFDANSLIGKKTGVGYYAYLLVENLAKQHPEIELVGHYFNFLNRKKIPKLPTANNISYRPSFLFPAKAYLGLRRIGISVPLEILGKGKFDLALFPNYFSTTSIFETKKMSIIHDFTYKLFPETVESRNLSALKSQVPLTVKRTSIFIVNSESIRNELCHEFGISKNRVIVVYPLLELPHRNPELKWSNRLNFLNKSKYIFFISSIEPRKNISTLLEAYVETSKTIHDMPKLVLAGGYGWKNGAMLKRISELQKEGYDIHLLGYVTEEERQKLYQEASLFVMPALYEGFGMTILEAMQYNVPCIASDIPIFRELGKAQGDIDYYSPATDVKALANQINKKLTKQSKKTVCNLEPFSWGKSIERLYRSINKEIKK